MFLSGTSFQVLMEICYGLHCALFAFVYVAETDYITKFYSAVLTD